MSPHTALIMLLIMVCDNTHTIGLYFLRSFAVGPRKKDTCTVVSIAINLCRKQVQVIKNGLEHTGQLEDSNIFPVKNHFANLKLVFLLYDVFFQFA